MSTAPKPVRFDNLAEMLKQLGVSARRIRAYPPPGKATEKDVIAIHDRTDPTSPSSPGNSCRSASARPTDPIAGLAPALAVEILSKGNTKREMDRKVREHFLCGVRLVWLVSLKSRTICVYTAPDQSVMLTEDETLNGGDVLPGLALPLRRVFAEVPAPTKASGRPKGKKPRRPNGRA